MIDIKKIQKSGSFYEVKLKDSEILFDEGQVDNNLYIVLSGSLSVEKYTTSDRKESKQLAIISVNGIFGEGSLSNSDPKEVKILSIENTRLLKIDAQKDFPEFISKFPKEGISILSEIINVSNKRLLESNSLVTANYEMSKLISEIKAFNNSNLFLLIDKLKKVLNIEYILFLEKNTVLDDYLSLKYDSRNTGKMSNIIIDTDGNELSLEKLESEGIKLGEYNLLENLLNGNESIGYLVIGNNTEFTDSEKKIIKSIGTLFAGVIKQKELFEEQKNREYLDE